MCVCNKCGPIPFFLQLNKKKLLGEKKRLTAKNLYGKIISTIKQRLGVSMENKTMANTKSTLISNVSYDGAAQKLTVSMSKGQTYAFAGVPQKVVTGLTTATSQGKYFNQNVRGRFPTTKISG